VKSYHDIAGDGGSQVLEQVLDVRQRIAQRLTGVRQRLAVASGKGGVGKSTLTLALARAWAARGQRVAILDVDLNGPSQAELAGLGERRPLPGEAGLRLPKTDDGIGVLSLGSLLSPEQALGFESVAPDESHTWRAIRERALLLDLLAGVEWGELDVLLLDLPPGAERTVQAAELFGPEAAFVLVTLPSTLSRGIVARSATALRTLPNRVLGYVENMAGPFPLDTTVEIGVPRLATVPFDPALAAGHRPDVARAAVDALAVNLGTLFLTSAQAQPATHGEAS